MMMIVMVLVLVLVPVFVLLVFCPSSYLSIIYLNGRDGIQYALIIAITQYAPIAFVRHAIVCCSFRRNHLIKYSTPGVVLNVSGLRNGTVLIT